MEIFYPVIVFLAIPFLVRGAFRTKSLIEVLDKNLQWKGLLFFIGLFILGYLFFGVLLIFDIAYYQKIIICLILFFGAGFVAMVMGICWSTVSDVLQINQLKREVQRDGLTDLYNRRYLDILLQSEIDRSEKLRCPLSIIMIDIDFFKSINDQYGHPAGDAVLKRLACVLRENTRQSDIIGRYGGEEFLIVLPGSSSDNAFFLAEKLRKKVSATFFDIQTNQSQQDEERIKVAISQGVGERFSEEDGITSQGLLKRADSALYKAKEEGRNRVCVYNKDRA